MAVELATGYVSIVPSARGFGQQLSREIDGPIDRAANDAGDRSGRSFVSRFTAPFRGIGGALAGAFVGFQAVNLIGDTVGAASDLSEAVNVTGLIFGEARGEIDAFARSASTSIGTSEAEARQLTASLGGLLSNMGLSSAETVEWSQRLAVLGADMGSAFNANPAEAIQAIGAGLRGESEPLRRFNVLLSDAAIRERAVEMGLAATTAEVDNAAKARAALSLITEQTSAIQGDFANTSDGLANRQRILGAQFTDMKARLGQALLPVMERVVGFLSSNMAPALESVRRVFGTVGDAVGEFVYFFRNEFNEGATNPVERFGIIVGELWRNQVKPFVDWAAAHWKPLLIAVGAAFIAITSPITAIAAGLVLLYARFEIVRTVVGTVVDFFTGTLIPAVSLVASYIAEQFGHLVAWVREHWAAIQEAIGHVLEAIKVAVAIFIAPIVIAWRLFGEEILEGVRIAWDAIKVVIETVLGVIRGVIETALALINGDWGTAWDAIKGIVGTIWDGIKGLVQLGIDGVFLILQTVLGTIRTAWETAWVAVRDFVAGVFTIIVQFIADRIAEIIEFWRTLPARIIEAIGDVAGLMVDVGRDLVEGLIAGIRAIGSQIWSTIMSFVPSPSDIASSLNPFGGPTISGDREAAEEWARRMAAGNATGGWFSGFSVVGEAGREVVFSPGRSLVVPNHKLMGAALPTGNSDQTAVVRLLRDLRDLLAGIEGNTASDGVSVRQLARTGAH